MKRIFSSFLTLVFLFCAAIPAFAQTPALYGKEPVSDNIKNAWANVEIIDGAAKERIKADDAPGAAYLSVEKNENLKVLLFLCERQGVVPTVEVKTQEEAKTLLAAMQDAEFYDVSAVSEDAALLSFLREENTLLRTGLILNDVDGAEDETVANAIRKKVRSAPATFCIVPSSISFDAVRELKLLCLNVWVRVDSAPTDEAFTAETLRALTSGANGIVSQSASAVFNVTETYFEKNTMTRLPLMIGHRGNPTNAPENSLSGFLTAYENGADILEADLEITADGEVIILHDDTLTRTTNYTGKTPVNQMTLEEVKSYYLLGTDGKVTDETVPTLREVLQAFSDKDCKFFLEFKGTNEQNAPAAAKIIREENMEHKVNVISFKPMFLSRIQAELPGMSTGFLSSSTRGSSSCRDALLTLSTLLPAAQENQSSINTQSTAISFFLMQAAVDRGMTVWPYTYNAKTNLDGFLASCDGLTTNDVQWAKNLLWRIAPQETAPLKLQSCESLSLLVFGETYGREKINLPAEDVLVTVLTGAELVTVENGVLTAKDGAHGEACLLLGYRTKLPNGEEYVLYAQPVTVTVTNPLLTLYLPLAAGVLLLGAATVTTLLIFKKRKQK